MPVKNLAVLIGNSQIQHKARRQTFYLKLEIWFLALFLFIFHAGSRRLGSNNFRNSNYKEKMVGSVRVSRLSLCFL